MTNTMNTFANTMNTMVDDMITMTEDTMDFGYKFHECFPYIGHELIEIDGVTYSIRMEVVLKKIKK